MQFLRLSNENGSDAVNMDFQLIRTEKFKPDVVLQHLNNLERMHRNY